MDNLITSSRYFIGGSMKGRCEEIITVTEFTRNILSHAKRRGGKRKVARNQI